MWEERWDREMDVGERCGMRGMDVDVNVDLR